MDGLAVIISVLLVIAWLGPGDLGRKLAKIRIAYDDEREKHRKGKQP